MIEPERCDFCSTRPVVWCYPCRDFVHVPPEPLRRYVPTFASREAWAACQACHELIERGNRKGLAERSARTHPQRRGVPLAILRDVCRGLHDDFWANREGPGEPIDGLGATDAH